MVRHVTDIINIDGSKSKECLYVEVIAKRAVEMAIEQDEQTALVWLTLETQEH